MYLPTTGTIRIVLCVHKTPHPHPVGWDRSDSDFLHPRPFSWKGGTNLWGPLSPSSLSLSEDLAYYPADKPHWPTNWASRARLRPDASLKSLFHPPPILSDRFGKTEIRIEPEIELALGGWEILRHPPFLLHRHRKKEYARIQKRGRGGKVKGKGRKTAPFFLLPPPPSCSLSPRSLDLLTAILGLHQRLVGGVPGPRFWPREQHGQLA